MDEDIKLPEPVAWAKPNGEDVITSAAKWLWRAAMPAFVDDCSVPCFTADQLRAAVEADRAAREKNLRDEGFNAGVCLALQIMTSFGDAGSTAWNELLNAAGREQVEHYAKYTDPDMWELSGFKDVARIRSEFGED